MRIRNLPYADHSYDDLRAKVADMLNKGALALAEPIRRRELSPTEVVEAHLARIDQVNPKLNAMVARRDEAARSEARRADQAVMQREPLLEILSGTAVPEVPRRRTVLVLDDPRIP